MARNIHVIAKVLRRIVPERLRPIGYLTHLVQTSTGLAVRQGPFTGMRYVGESQGSAYLPKLLGIYERELILQVEGLVERAPKLVVDIGAAEGYYAVGLARRLPQARIVAFEMEPRGRRALREMAQLNSVSDRIEVRGKCEASDLAAVLKEDTAPAVVCDVEGYEQCLLDPKLIPALVRTTILVELHDFLVPNITETLMGRFATTHRIMQVRQEPRTRAEFPWRTMGTTLLSRSYLDWAVSEWRPARMAWLWMLPG